MAKNRIADNGKPDPLREGVAAEVEELVDEVKEQVRDPRRIVADARAKLHAEFNAKLGALCDEYGIDIVPQTVLVAKFRQ